MNFLQSSDNIMLNKPHFVTELKNFFFSFLQISTSVCVYTSTNCNLKLVAIKMYIKEHRCGPNAERLRLRDKPVLDSGT